MAQIVVEMSADEHKLLQAFQKIVAAQAKMDAGYKKVGQTSKRAGETHKESFGTKALTRMAAFAASAVGVQQIFGKIVQSMQQADTELNNLASKQITAASGLGKLQQLSNDPKVIRAMRNEARKTFLSGGAADMDKAGDLQFALESAGIPQMRADFAALQSNKIIGDAAVMAESAAALQAGMTSKETGTFRNIVSKSFGALMGARASAEEMLQAAAEGGEQARRIGLSDEEHLAAIATVAKVSGPKAAGTMVEQLEKQIEKEGFGKGLLKPGRTLTQYVADIQKLEAGGTNIRDILGSRQEAITAAGLLGSEGTAEEPGGRQRMITNLANIEQAQREDWMGIKLRNAALALPEVAGARGKAKATARADLSADREASMRTVTDILIADRTAQSRDAGIPGFIEVMQRWTTELERRSFGDAGVAMDLMRGASPQAREDALLTMAAMQQAATELQAASTNLRDATDTQQRAASGVPECAHGIDVFDFVHWQGPPPRIAQEHTIAHNRPGADGVALQLLGKWGDPFEVVLTSHYSSGVLAADGFALMNEVVGSGWLAVKYATLNYTFAYATGYHATMIEQLDLRVSALLIGPGYAYTNGGVLITRWTLHPEAL